MLLELHRTNHYATSTVGKLSVDGVPECYICEDVVRPTGQKVHGKTAIPAGEYRVIIDMSNRFKRLLPLLVNVPGYAGVRIHTGNTSADTEGCLLPGTADANGAVLNSRVAFGKLFDKMQAAIARGQKITIRIYND